jgi:hypothetical protein
MTTRGSSSRSRRTCTPEDLLRDHSPAVQALAERARALVKRELPGVEERAYPGWRIIGFRYEGAYLGYVAPQEDHVRLGFECGVLLKDPDGLLEGEGNQVRYVRLVSVEDVPEQALARLLHQAVAISKGAARAAGGGEEARRASAQEARWVITLRSTGAGINLVTPGSQGKPDLHNSE